MKEPTKLPKTFLVFVENNDGKFGYVRLASYHNEKGGIDYGIKLVKKISDASRYVTLENSKAKAKALKEKYKFDSVQVIDEATKKSYLIH